MNKALDVNVSIDHHDLLVVKEEWKSKRLSKKKLPMWWEENRMFGGRGPRTGGPWGFVRSMWGRQVHVERITLPTR